MNVTTTSSLLKYLGLTGSSTVRTGALVPRANTPDADQRLYTDFLNAGRMADPDIWTKFNTVMKRPTTLESMYQLWEEMAGWDLIAAALIEIVDEAIQTDANSPGTLWFQCNDKDFEEELNDLVKALGIEELLPSQVWHVSAMGNHFEKIEYTPSEGVTGLSYIHPMEVRRYWLERNRKCIGYKWMGHKPNKEDVFVMPDNQTPVERVSLSNGQNTEDLWYPWDILHMRRMYRMRASEHGEPIFAEADGIYKKLRLAVDQMVVHRAQVQPVRYAINIDVQEQTPIEQMKTVQRWRQALRSKLAFGQSGNADQLNSPTDFNSYYNAMALDTIFYVAQPKGFTNSIDQLNGTADVPDVYDIELLTDLFYSIIGMPRSWFGSQTQGGNDAPSGKALLAQDIRFLRKIKSIRRPITQSYEWLAYFHAVLKGKDVTNLDIKAMMPPIGSLEEQMKMELLGMQCDILDKLAGVMDKFQLPKEAWTEVIFKRYMHLPDEVVNVFLTALPSPIEQKDQQESKTNAPTTARLVRHIEDAVGKTPGLSALVGNMRKVLNEGQVRGTGKQRKNTVESVLGTTKLRPQERVISSYGRHPFELNCESNQRKPNVGTTSYFGKVTPLTESTVQDRRTWMREDDAASAEPPKVGESTQATIPDAQRKFLAG